MPLGLSKKLGSFRGKKPSEQDSGGTSLSAIDPDLLHNLPIGAELVVDEKGNVVSSAPQKQSECLNEESSKSKQAESFSGSEGAEAHSFDSIDTISQRSTHFEGDVDAEKHRRMKKLLKYSQWIKKRTDGDDQKEESRSVLALERKMARQEEKLDKLYATKPRDSNH